MGRLVAEFAADEGVSTPRMFDGPPAPFNIVFIPREFQPMGETFDERFLFVGPCVGGRDLDGEWTHEGPRPLLFISLGTTPLNRRPEFFRMCLEALGQSKWDVALATGEETDLGSLGTIPANVRVQASFPQLLVLRQADVFLTHAGMNSTMEALYFGVPMVAFPQQPEQEATSGRLEELGLGRRLPAEELTPAKLLDAVSEVSADGQIRQAVAAMSATVRNAGGAAAAAAAIEAHQQNRFARSS